MNVYPVYILYLEESHLYSEKFSNTPITAISGFNYLHFLSPFELVEHLIASYLRLSPGGKYFGLAVGTNFDEDNDLVVQALKSQNAFLLRAIPMPVRVNTLRGLCAHQLSKYYKEKAEPFPGYVNPQVDKTLDEKVFHGHRGISLDEGTLRSIANKIGFDIISVDYSGVIFETGQFEQRDNGGCINFVLEKSRNSEHDPWDTRSVELIAQKLFPEYQNIEENRRQFHEDNKFDFLPKYPFIFIDE